MTKLKAFADYKLNVAKIIISLLDRVENTVRKGENVGYYCFPNLSSIRSLKVGVAYQRVKSLLTTRYDS